VKTDESEEQKVEVFAINKSAVTDSDFFFEITFGHALCDEMFQIEKEFTEHCFQACYSPVDVDFAERQKSAINVNCASKDLIRLIFSATTIELTKIKEEFGHYEN